MCATMLIAVIGEFGFEYNIFMACTLGFYYVIREIESKN